MINDKQISNIFCKIMNIRKANIALDSVRNNKKKWYIYV